MPKKRSLTVIILLIVLLTFSCGLLYGCKSDEAKETSKTEGKKTADVIKLAGGDWGYPTPYGLYPRGPGSRKMRLVYDSLVSTDADGRIVPKLATEWKESDDGLVYNFKTAFKSEMA